MNQSPLWPLAADSLNFTGRFTRGESGQRAQRTPAAGIHRRPAPGVLVRDTQSSTVIAQEFPLQIPGFRCRMAFS
jgi:hypothetical protein